MTRPRRRLLSFLIVLGAIMASASWLHSTSRRRAQERAVREAFLAHARALGYDTIVFGPNSFDEKGLGVLDLSTGRRVRNLPASLPNARGTFPSVAVDGRTVGFCAEGAVEVVDIPAGRLIGRFAPAEREVVPRPMSWSPDGRRLAVFVTHPGRPEDWPDGGTPVWILEPEKGTGTLVVALEVPREAMWRELHWRADGRALYIYWREYSGHFCTWEVDAVTGSVIQGHSVAVKVAGPDGRLVVRDADGLWRRRTPEDSGIPLAAARKGSGHRFLGNSGYLVYVRPGKFRPSAFLALDTETGVSARVADFGIGVPVGFDLACRRQDSGDADGK